MAWTILGPSGSSGASTPGLPDTAVQFNAAGEFAGDSTFVFDSVTKTLTAQELLIAENAIIEGNLSVRGSTISVDSESLNIGDNHIYLNAANTSIMAQTGGLVVNVGAVSPLEQDTVTAGPWVAGIAATSNPQVTTVGAATFAVNDIIQVSDNDKNNGIYEVLSHAANILTIRGLGTVPTVEPWTDSQFADDADPGVITKVNVTVLLGDSDGAWSISIGSETPFDFSDLGDVIGPDGAGSDHIALFDGVTGKLLKQSILSQIEAGNDVIFVGPGDITYLPVGKFEVLPGINEDIILRPHGTGLIDFYNGAYQFPNAIGTDRQSLTVPTAGTLLEWTASGDVIGPDGSADRALAYFNGTTGKILEEHPDLQVFGTSDIAIDVRPRTDIPYKALFLESFDGTNLFQIAIDEFDKVLMSGTDADVIFRTFLDHNLTILSDNDFELTAAAALTVGADTLDITVSNGINILPGQNLVVETIGTAFFSESLAYKTGENSANFTEFGFKLISPTLIDQGVIKGDGAGNVVSKTVIEIDDAAGIRVTDSTNSVGFFYDASYASGATDRWLTDKGYVDTQVATRGDVFGPASSGEGHLVTYDGLTGKIIQDGSTLSLVKPADTNALVTPDHLEISADDITVDPSGKFLVNILDGELGEFTGNVQFDKLFGTKFYEYTFEPGTAGDIYQHYLGTYPPDTGGAITEIIIHFNGAGLSGYVWARISRAAGSPICDIRTSGSGNSPINFYWHNDGAGFWSLYFDDNATNVVGNEVYTCVVKSQGNFTDANPNTDDTGIGEIRYANFLDVVQWNDPLYGYNTKPVTGGATHQFEGDAAFGGDLTVGGETLTPDRVGSYFYDFSYQPGTTAIYEQYLGQWSTVAGPIEITIQDSGTGYNGGAKFVLSRESAAAPISTKIVYNTHEYEIYWREISDDNYELFFWDPSSGANVIAYDVTLDTKEVRVSNTLSAANDTGIVLSTQRNFERLSVNTVEVFSPSDLPAPSGGFIVLEDTTYLLKDQVVTTNGFRPVDGGSIRFETTNNPIIYATVGTFFDVPAGEGMEIFRESFLPNIAAVFNAGVSLYNITAKPASLTLLGITAVLVETISYIGFYNLGDIKKFSVVAITQGFYSNFVNGLVLEDCKEATFTRCEFVALPITTSAMIQSSGSLVSNLQLINCVLRGNPTKPVVRIDPAVPDDARFILSGNTVEGGSPLFDTSGVVGSEAGTFTAVADASVASTTIDSVSSGTAVGGGATSAFFNYTVGPTLYLGQQVTITGFVTNTAYNVTGVVSDVAIGIFELEGVVFGTDEAGGSFTSDSVTLTEAGTTMIDGVGLVADTALGTTYDGGTYAYNKQVNSFQINRPFNGTATGTWSTAGLDQHNPRVLAINNPGYSSSQTLGFGMTHNSLIPTPVVDGTYGAVSLGILVTGEEERLKLIDPDACIWEVTSNEPVTLTFNITSWVSKSGATRQDYRMAIAINGVVPTFATEPYERIVATNTATQSVINLEKVGLVKGDQVQPMVAGDGTAVSLVFEDFTIQVIGVS